MFLNRRAILLSLLVAAACTTTVVMSQEHKNIRGGRRGISRRNSNSNDNSNNGELLGEEQHYRRRIAQNMGKGKGGGNSRQTKPNDDKDKKPNDDKDKNTSTNNNRDEFTSRVGTGVGSNGNAASSSSGNPFAGYSSSACFNDINFVDDLGDDCIQYTLNWSRCQTALEFANTQTGLSAANACCICGGGHMYADWTPPAQGQGPSIIINNPNSDNGGIEDRVGSDNGNAGGNGVNVGAQFMGGRSDNDCLPNLELCIEDTTCKNCCSGKYRFLPLNGPWSGYCDP